MDGYEPSSYGDAFADVYDEWYGDVSDVEGTVAAVVELAAGRPVLELGVGTGRLALPIAARGLEVHGIDASEAMIERLRSKPGADAVTATVADMAGFSFTPGHFGVVLAAFNTFFNLTSAQAQAACLERVSASLAPDGFLVVEAFLPSEPPAQATGALEVRDVGIDRVHLTATWRDPVAQTVAGQHIEISETGIGLRPWFLRYASPDELDAMAAHAGLALQERWSDWQRHPFDAGGDRHVSVYAKPSR